MVLTIIILIILATVTMNLAFGENGLITKAQLAKEQYEIEQVREKLEMAKASAVADGRGSIDPDHYFDIIEDEGIIGNKENDVKDNEDGTYEVTTNEGYIFEITLVPTKENPEDIEIDYIGKGESTRPRISTIDVTGKTTNSISVKVEGKNLDGAEYTYYYKKSSEGEESWKEYSTDKSSNTCTISGLETKVVYDIKVVVTTSKGTDNKEISEITGELAEGSITIENTEWQGDGTAKVTVTTDITEPGCYIEYKVGTDGSWTRIESGKEITLQLNDEIYVRVTDGTNTLAEAYRKIEDNGKPIVTVTQATKTSNSITVNVQATDAESGMKENITYTYYIKESGEADTEYEVKAEGITNASYTFTELNQNTSYDIKVLVDGDKAGNTAEGKLENETTNEVGGATEGLKEGSIVATAPSWSNGQASITLTTNTGLQIQYQKGGIAGTWTTINSGEQVTGLNHNDIVYARLWDGRNAGAEASVEIQDTGKPVISNIATSNITSNSITVTVTASDNETGLATSGTYKYYLNNGSPVTSTSNSYQFTGLTAGINYTIKVEVFDKAGNSTTATSNAKTNAVPGVPTVTFKSKTTNSITVQAKATDADGGKLTYTLYTSTSSSGNYKKAATATGNSGNNVSLTASGLSQYTKYYYYVTVTDQISNNQSAKANQRTYCPGTGHTVSYCSGTSTTNSRCTNCNGQGYIYSVCSTCEGDGRVWYCPECGTTLPKGNSYIEPSSGDCKCYVGIWWERRDCTACGKTGSQSTKCQRCYGTGTISTSVPGCVHGKNSSHYYCNTSGCTYTGSSNHCVHGNTSQHD